MIEGGGSSSRFHEGEGSVFSTPDSGMYPQLRSGFDLDENSPGNADDDFQQIRFFPSIKCFGIFFYFK